MQRNSEHVTQMTAQDKIIHHSSYVVYVEVSRVEFFREIGMDLNEIG